MDAQPINQPVTLMVRLRDAEDLRLDYADLDVAVRVIGAMLRLDGNGITGWSIASEPEPCPHNGLFAVAPTHAITEEERQAWLVSTKRCHDCQTDVPNRDL